MSEAGAPYSADEVGKRVRALRAALGYESQAAFAEAIGAKPGEIGAWESGGRRPGIPKAEAMVKRFRITLDWLFLGDPSKLPYELAVSLADKQSALSASDRD